jgi:iron transport multicopper oxidase
MEGLVNSMRKRGAAWLAVLALAPLVPAGARAAAITNSSEDLRTGWYPGETSITPELVEGGTYGQEWERKVSGQVYAQPLLDGSTLLVATEQNHVYGLDPATGLPRWEKTLPHGTPWNPQDLGCADLTPSVGVTSTPVIDTSSNTAYLTHKTYVSGSSGPARWWMDAIDMSSGEERPGFPVALEGEAQNLEGVQFDAADELQRPGLLLLEGVVYAAFGSHCDHPPYEGWVFGVSTSGAVKARWAADREGAGIWQSGAGLTSDEPGSILLTTGNGAVPKPPILGSAPPEDLGQSVVRLKVQPGGALQAVDFFAPYEASELNTWDADFGSGGVTGLPGPWFGTAAIPDLAVVVGKDGYVYLLNRDDLGGYGVGKNGQDDVVQRLGPNGGVWSRPGVWPGEGGWVYIPTASASHSASGSSGNLDVYRYGLTAEGQPSLTLAGVSSEAFGFSSGPPVITSNGTENGSALVWVVWAPNGTGEGAQLRAYAARPVSKAPVLLWSEPVGRAAKFATPGVGLGRIYVGTRDERVVAFGSPVTPAISGGRTEFPPTNIGANSERTLTLTANSEVTVEAIDSSDPQFQVGASTPKPPVRIEPGQHISVPLTFRPAAAGPQAATLRVLTAGGQTLPFSLEGTGRASGAELEASPPVLTFGGATPGSTISEAVLLKDVGSASLTIARHSDLAPPFHFGTLPSKLEPEEEVSVPIEFTPTEYGSFSGSLEIETTEGQTATIHLTGVSAPAGLLQIAPETVEFGAIPVGGEATRSFAITNSGGLPVKINISKPPIAAEFRATTSLPEGESAIAPGETVTETVRFAPTGSGPSADVWRIAGEDASGPHEVRFAGDGVQPTATPLAPVLPASGSALSFTASRAASRLVSTRLLESRGGVISVRVGCSGPSGACRGTLAVSTVRRFRRHGRLATLRLGSASFSLLAGHDATLRLRLSPALRKLLDSEPRLHVRVTLSTGTSRVEKVLTLLRER